MKRIVVIGTSSGGLEALRTLIAGIPPDFSAPICVVMHTSPDGPGVLPEILDRTTRLVVAHARDGEALQEGRVYVAPPDRHVLLEPARLRVTKGPRENRFRPAIDPLFRSAAQVFGPGAVGVLLTGNLDDGTSGLDVIKRLGGVAIVQDPADALFPSMPQSAIDHVNVDYVVPLDAVAPLLVELAKTPAEPWTAEAVPEEVEIRSVAERHDSQARVAHPPQSATVGDERAASINRVLHFIERRNHILKGGVRVDQRGLGGGQRHAPSVCVNEPFHIATLRSPSLIAQMTRTVELSLPTGLKSMASSVPFATLVRAVQH